MVKPEGTSDSPNQGGLGLKVEESERPGLSQGHGSVVSQKVRIIRVKDFAARSLPEASILRGLLLEERDELDREEFLAKMDLWLKLLKMDSQ
jgi:hypothetical protein